MQEPAQNYLRRGRVLLFANHHKALLHKQRRHNGDDSLMTCGWLKVKVRLHVTILHYYPITLAQPSALIGSRSFES
jgi:hypothetical protein